MISYFNSYVTIEILTGSYEIDDLAAYLEKYRIKITYNKNTVHSYITSERDIGFVIPKSPARLLGFTPKLLRANIKHESNYPIDILKVNTLRIECNITTGAYVNQQKFHTIYNFFPAVPPGYEIPYMMLSNKNKIDIMKYIQKDPVISIGFRSWDLYEYTLLPQTTHYIWTVKTATQLEKPRYVILGFQSNRKNDWQKDVTHFDHCKITNVKLYLNFQIFLYGNLNLDIEKNQFPLLYDMYANSAESYYGSKIDLVSKDSFIKKSPLIVIDCSKQNEFLKISTVDVGLEFELKENFPQGTTVYCLILHDKRIDYRTISGIVHKLT
ncbi:uncharacterized protein LOC122850516 [Aphidius gifuensis]|uniref:uncharacterized protein LOC122850516 n=1 Tax=Aphidius gifuensis TaxID=684658 RepID=UPI001CDCAA63|nr:uncharacterized protein LOC122850516 [Aphidius gifuensis]